MEIYRRIYPRVIVLKYWFFLIGVLVGIGVLYTQDAIPPPFHRFGSHRENPTRIVIFKVRIHHSTVGIGLVLIASFLRPYSPNILMFILGIGMLFFLSQVPEIIQQGTLFWDDRTP